MRKNWKILLILALLSLSSCSEQKEDFKIKKVYKTDIVASENLENIYSYIWYTKWVNQVMLATKNPWKIKYLKKKIWDKVRAWEIILSLWNEEANNWYYTSNNIISSLNRLKSSIEKSYKWQENAMKVQLEKAKIWISGTEKWLENIKNIKDESLKTLEKGIEQAELWIKTAKTNLEKSEDSINQSNINLIKNSKSAITNSLILYKNIIEYTDIILSQTLKNKNSNKYYKNYLSARDKTFLVKAKKDFWLSKNILATYQKDYNLNIENKQNISEESMKNSLKLWSKTAESMKILMKDMWNVMEKTIASIWSISSQEVAIHKNQFSNFWSKIEASLLTVSWDYILWIDWSLQNFDNIKTQKSKAISLLEKQVEQAEAWLKTAKQNYEQYKSINNSKVDEVETKTQIAKKSIDEIKAWINSLKSAKKAKLREVDAKIAEVVWKKYESQVNIANWKIISPISWIIYYKNAEVWQVVNWWTPVYWIADTSNLLIKVDVPNSIIDTIKIWDKVKVQRESSTEKLKAKISNIAQSQNQITKKTQIEVKIKNKDWKIKIWEMIKVFFEIKNKDSKKKGITIPNNAIISQFMIPWVYVLKDNKVIFKKIKILNTNEFKSSVSWLNKWEVIITDWKENIYDWEILK